MTLLTTLIFDFHYVVSALTTPITTPTPSLMKTSLWSVQPQKVHHRSFCGTFWEIDLKKYDRNNVVLGLVPLKEKRKVKP